MTTQHPVAPSAKRLSMRQNALRLRPLRPDHIPLILGLDRDMFPPEYMVTAEELLYYLAGPSLHGENLSAGLFDGSDLVGYIVMIAHPSLFEHHQRVAFMFRMTIRPRYRRTGTPLMVRWITQQALMCNYSVEGRMRYSTSYRTVHRYWKMLRQLGARLTGVAEQAPIGTSRTIHMRLELVTPRSNPGWPLYNLLAHGERARRKAFAFPRRVLNKLCKQLPDQYVPEALRRVAFLPPKATAAETI